MLCCWLQQLQEFGGPEVEKPDLLQLGSVNSLRPYLQASSGNMPRSTFFKDPRARYNVSIPQTPRMSIDNKPRDRFMPRRCAMARRSSVLSFDPAVEFLSLALIKLTY